MPGGVRPPIEYQQPEWRAGNAVLRRLEDAGIGTFALSAGAMIDDARRQTGLREFGDESFLPGLEVLLDSYRTEADLNPFGRALVRETLVRRLKNRLWAADLFRRHPEILLREIRAPVVVMGLGRSGTTRLHRMLATDARFTHLKTWEVQYPVPWPESFTAADDPRIEAYGRWQSIYLHFTPGRDRFHPFNAFEADEESLLLLQSFSSVNYLVHWRLPAFAHWTLETDQGAAYEYMLRLMKLAAWFRDDPPERPWILKSPAHMLDLPALMRIFPDARLVWTHRDPAQALRSVCAYAWNAIVQNSDTASPEYVGELWLRIVRESLHRAERDRPVCCPAQRQHDVLFESINRDWRAALRGIYGFIGLPFTAEAEQGMAAWLERNRANAGSPYRTTLRDFGLDEDAVDASFQPHRDRHGIPREHRGAAAGGV
ncbi:MAG: sulfotransferase [Gammaproteobacteria bacterium]